MSEGWSRGQRLAMLAASAAVVAGLWLTGDRSVGSFALVLLSVGAALAVAWLSRSRPATAFGILFLVATLSRGTIATPVGNMRLEQPAIVAGFAALLVAPSRLDVRRLRPLWPIGAAFAVYLVCLGLSSVLFAPDRAASLRITFWTALSMASGLLAFLLLARSRGREETWICLSGYVQALAGILFALLFFTLGPVLVAGSDPAPGVQDPLSSLPKVFALSWEANLYASLLAALTLFGLDRVLSGRRLLDKVLVPMMVGAIALGMTRAAYLGLAAGLAAYALAAVAPRREDLKAFATRHFWTRPAIRRVGIPVAALAGSLVVGGLVAAVLLPGGRPPTQPLDLTQPGFGRGAVAVGSGSGKPAPTPSFKVMPAPDNVTFRLDRIGPALDELKHSLLIGLGADSFGQRHSLPSQPGQPDHIAILAVAALYESGAFGAAGLAVGFALLLLMLLKSAWRRTDRGLIAAYFGALVCLLVTYEATNALNFSLIWLLAGAGLAAALSPSEPSPSSSPPRRAPSGDQAAYMPATRSA